LSSSGGTAPYRWSVSGALPPGLTLDPSAGILAGIPTANGNYTFTVQVADSTGLTASKSLSLTINPAPLIITTDTLFSATVGLPYSQIFSATGGVAPYRWSLISGQPGGLTFTPDTATLAGTPQTTGSFNFTIQVTDSLGATTSRSYTLTVENPRLSILTSSPLPAGTVGAAYSVRQTATGGVAPYSWTITGASVPGLTLDAASGVLSGVPTSPGTFSFTIAVRDASGGTASKSFSVIINPSVLNLTSSRDLNAATVGTNASYTLTAAGGVPPYTWSATGLPAGMNLDAATGILSGTPSTPGSYSFAVRVTDSVRTTATDLFRISVGIPSLPVFTLDGLPATADPASQPKLRLLLSSGFPVPLTGQLVLSFAPDSGAGDGTIQFSQGGRSASFKIDPNSTEASFSAPDFALQTGTVAGTIRVTVQLQVSDVDVTPNPAPVFSARVERSAPKVNSVTVTRAGSVLTVRIVGFATSREVTDALFHFTPASGSSLQTSDVRISVDTLFSTWFQAPASAQLGSQFAFSQPFNIQGDVNAVNLDSVVLTNRVGSTTAKP
jgi:hypothetical protein